MRFFRLLKIISVGSALRARRILPRPRARTRLAPGHQRLALLAACSTRRARCACGCALEALGPIFVKFGQVLSTRRDCCRPTSPTSWRSCRTRCRHSRRERRARDAGTRLRPAARRGVRHFRPHARRQRVGRAGALRPAARRDAKSRSRCCGPASREIIAQGYGAARRRREPGRDAVGRRQAPAPARGRRRVREAPGGRARSHARSGQREPAAAQLPATRRCCSCREVYWDYCRARYGDGAHARHAGHRSVAELRGAGHRHPRLARAGVEIFFTQVFRDGFFHADMHPGNIFVSPPMRHATWRSISASWARSPTIDKHYLAQNFLAFFRRDYRRVAQAHIESGWAPPRNARGRVRSRDPRGVRADLRAAAEGDLVRHACCCACSRPRAASTSQVQPQLVLLQKTLLNIEGLGRQLDPDLDLWRTAKPYLERWMTEQIGWRGLVRAVRRRGALLGHAAAAAQLPRLAHRCLTGERTRSARATTCCALPAAAQPHPDRHRRAAGADRNPALLAALSCAARCSSRYASADASYNRGAARGACHRRPVIRRMLTHGSSSSTRLFPSRSACGPRCASTTPSDFAVAGRQPAAPIVTATVFATWFGAETVLGISATFVQGGPGRRRRRSVRLEHVPDSRGLFFARPLYRMNL